MHCTKIRPMTFVVNIYHSHGIVCQSTLNLTYLSYVTYNLETSFVTPLEIIELQFSYMSVSKPALRSKFFSSCEAFSLEKLIYRGQIDTLARSNEG